MKVLAIHNFYKQPGGEDNVFHQEIRLLRSKGHAVTEFTVHNDEIDKLSKWSLARNTFWNDDVYRKMRNIIRYVSPDVAHFHNTFPLLSPSGYYAARDEGVRIVQTLHNYRLMCPAGTFLRKGHVCEECIGRSFAWPGVIHRCYRDSVVASGLSASMLAYHWHKGTWASLVDVYVALNEFAREKFIRGGLPEEKMVVKPNFLLEDPGAGGGGGGYAVYVGRLSSEKGIKTLLEAWRHLEGRIPLKVVGDGPLREIVGTAARSSGRIEWLGQRSLGDVYAILAAAEVMICPSECYEGAFPLSIIEAFACGTPVIASKIGGIPEFVKAGLTGRLFKPGAPEELVKEVESILENTHQLQVMRKTCRQTYLSNFTSESAYPRIMAAYRRALAN